MNKKILLFVGIVIALTGVGLFGSSYIQERNETDDSTPSAENVNQGLEEMVGKSQFIAIKQGETRNITPMDITLSIDKLNVLPCVQDQAQPMNANSEQERIQVQQQDDCHIRRADITIMIARKPTKDEESGELKMDPPKTMSFESVPGFQQNDEHSIQLVEYKDDILRLIIREL